ncbi:MAG TPA: glycosyltransferase family 4 protein [Longimicrobiales bacterium]|nr:glycosyltransferase family 4 protein [Longimicrobiales bacterium]
MRPPARANAAPQVPAPAADTAGRGAPRPLRVLIVVPWDQETGGVASVVGNLAVHLRRGGHTPVFFHPAAENHGLRKDRTAWGFPGFTAHLRSPSAPAHRLRSPVAFGVFLPQTLLRLVRVIRAERIDIVNVHYPVDAFVYFAFCRRLPGVRLVTSIHGSDVFPDGRLGAAPSRLVRRLLAASDLVVSPSARYRDAVVDCVPELAGRAVVVYNGIDVDEFAAPPATAPADPPPADFVLCIAGLMPWKGIDVLLRAFARVAGGHPGLRLVEAGGGPDDVALRQLAEHLGIADRVDFLGAVPRATIIRLLHGCRFLVLPSLAESFGIAAVEAMACGRAVVGSAVGGIPEIVTHGETGLLVPPEDDRALAEAMQLLLRDPDLARRFGRAGEVRARAEFRAEQTGEAYVAHFIRLVAARNAARAATRSFPWRHS